MGIEELLDSEDKYLAGLKRCLAITDTVIPKIKDGFGEVGSAVKKTAVNINDLYDIQGNTVVKGEVIVKYYNKLDSAAKVYSSTVKELGVVLSTNSANDVRQQEEKLLLHEQYLGRFVELLTEEYTAKQAHDKLLEGLEERRDNVLTAINTGMKKQMLSLIETKKFSVRAMKDLIFQDVKNELAGFAAKAAVKAVYFTAVGFAKLAQWDFPAAGAAFKSAAGFVLVSGASIAAASALQTNISRNNGGGTGSNGTAVKSLQSTVPLNNNVSSEPAKQVQHVTVVINNPLSEQNWDQIAENNIIPAINAAKDRNIELEVVSV